MPNKSATLVAGDISNVQNGTAVGASKTIKKQGICKLVLQQCNYDTKFSDLADRVADLGTRHDLANICVTADWDPVDDVIDTVTGPGAILAQDDVDVDIVMDVQRGTTVDASNVEIFQNDATSKLFVDDATGKVLKDSLGF